jgi:hypothetical protein
VPQHQPPWRRQPYSGSPCHPNEKKLLFLLLFVCFVFVFAVLTRSLQAEMDGQLVATWSDTGCVHLWDVSKHVAALDGVSIRRENTYLSVSHGFLFSRASRPRLASPCFRSNMPMKVLRSIGRVLPRTGVGGIAHFKKNPYLCQLTFAHQLGNRIMQW